METLCVKINKKFDRQYEVGKTYEIDGDTAKNWIESGLAEQVADQTADLIEGLEKTLAERDERLLKSIAESFKAKNSKVPSISIRDKKPSLGDYIKALGDRAGHKLRDSEYNEVAKSLNITTSGQGPELTFTEFKPDLLSVEYGYGSFWRKTNVVPLGQDKCDFPALDQTATPSGGSSAFFGGINFGVVSEGSAPGSETKPGFKTVSLNCDKVLGYTYVTEEMYQDNTINLDKFLMQNYALSVDSRIDYWVLQGSGTNQPTGLIGHASAVTINRNTANRVKLVDLAAMRARFIGNLASAVWIVSPLVYSELLTMESSIGQLVWINNVVGVPTMLLFGIPVMMSEHASTLGEEGDVGLYDLSKYVMGVRKDVDIRVSDQYKFLEGLLTFRLVMRLAGKPQLTAPIKLADGTTEVSPFVILGDVAS